MSWEQDGADIPLDELVNVAYCNKVVEQFLKKDSRRRILCGGKGMGKTLLLSLKRSQLFDEYDSARSKGRVGEPAVKFIPMNRPFLDCMGQLANLSRNWLALLSSCRESEKLWGLSYLVSALAHSGPRDVPARLEGINTGNIGQWLSDRVPVAPTIVCHELLNLSPTEFQRLYADYWNELDHAYRQLRTPMFFFVDKVDQACGHLEKSAWINFQNGLLLATMELERVNPHIKAFTTIRQEAFANIDDPRTANARSMMAHLEYDEHDLLQLLNKLAQFYEKKHTFVEFLGRDTVVNTTGGCTEQSYKYMLRHTLQRPRDLVSIAEGLSLLNQPVGDEQFKECTHRRSAQLAGNEAFNELLPFLSCLRSSDDRARFFRLLPFNILTRQVMEDVCRELNEDETIEDFTSDAIRHPFCELYSAGLLGVVTQETDGAPQYQSFKRPSDPSPAGARDLPQSDFYFLHPGLIHVIRKENREYRLLRYMAVGDGYDWSDGCGDLVRGQLEFFAVERDLDEVAKEHFWSLIGWHAGFIPSNATVRIRSRVSPTEGKGMFDRLWDDAPALLKSLVWVDKLGTAHRPRDSSSPSAAERPLSK